MSTTPQSSNRSEFAADLVDLVKAMRIVDVPARSRQAAIRSLVRAMDLEAEGVEQQEVLDAIDRREATARTIVDKGLAMPHAVIDWDGDFRIVLGRSRAGVDYGIPDDPRVHLIVLFVVGRERRGHVHLRLLAALAELLDTDDFRRQLVEARDTQAAHQILLQKAGLSAEPPTRTALDVLETNTLVVRQAIELVEPLSAQGLLLAVDDVDSVPWDFVSHWDGRLIVVTPETGVPPRDSRPDTHVLEMPHVTLTRMDRAKLGVLLAGSAGLLVGDACVVCVTGRSGPKLDSISVTRLETRLAAMFHREDAGPPTGVPAAVLLRALSLAIELAAEGREGHSVGTMFVIGDTPRVLERVRQLVLNPFHGYEPCYRQLLDPSLSETIKEFAQLDGAFVVQDDGTVVSAGTYIIPKAVGVTLQYGLGTRHQAAAAITATTCAIAITVSQSSGTVAVFQNGQILLQLERASQLRS